MLADTTVHAQLLKKLKDKVAQKVLGTTPVDSSSSSNSNSSAGSSSSGSPVNKGGAGLKSTPPPDVNQPDQRCRTSQQCS